MRGKKSVGKIAHEIWRAMERMGAEHIGIMKTQYPNAWEAVRMSEYGYVRILEAMRCNLEECLEFCVKVMQQ